MTEAKRDIVPERVGVERMPADEKLIRLGQWYWLKVKEYDEKVSDELVCVTDLGSNYAELTAADSEHGRNWRIHLDTFDKECRPEPDPESVIRQQTEHYRNLAHEKLGEIKQITARLGLSQRKPEHVQEVATRALSSSSGTDVKQYKKDLIKAKEKQLPELFKEVEEAHKHLAIWMKARALPMMASAGRMKECIAEIDDRIFNISLYAGLTEEVVQFAKGDPAGEDEKLRIMQRLLYMDEECLLNYRLGGMDFDNIKDFDKWLAKPENRDRCLPSPRCMTAFQVRRHTKERDWGGDLATLWVNIRMGDLDKLTFLYIRNGERLYRMNCDLEFGELIFPGKDEFNLNEPMMAKVHGFHKIETLITVAHYEELVKQEEERKAKLAAWRKAKPKAHEFDAPYELRDRYADLHDYEAFNDASVYFDDVKEEIERRIKQYNRIALIVQGLYDRSEVLHPHPPVKLWSAGGFESAVELIYDGSNVLHYGEPPSWEEYRASCNKSLKEGCIAIGQEHVFCEREAAKENARYGGRRNWHDLTSHFPYGNPGPGYLAKVEHWNANQRKATFRWTRERQRSTWEHDYGELLPCSMTVQEDRLFNVTAYKPGDFKQFFVDPRSRAQYLKWAACMLTAEEYHAKNPKVKVGPKERK